MFELPPRYAAAWLKFRGAAMDSLILFQDYAPNRPRVPGMDTAVRLAVRLDNGRTVEEAAAAEYLYRWRLALDALESSLRRSRPNPFAAHYAPHAFGL